jgi:hypothetical protein
VQGINSLLKEGCCLLRINQVRCLLLEILVQFRIEYLELIKIFFSAAIVEQQEEKEKKGTAPSPYEVRGQGGMDCGVCMFKIHFSTYWKEKRTRRGF